MSNFEKLGVPENIDAILTGSDLHVLATGGGMRVARIVEPESKNLLGYGMDTSIDSALYAAQESYATRELFGHTSVDFTEYKDIYDQFRVPEFATDAEPVSELDSFVLSRGEMYIEKDDEGVLAWSMRLGREYGARADTLRAAVGGLLSETMVSR